MYNDNKVIAIIVAAGSGKRFGSTLPKQFLKTGSETVLQKAVRAFDENKYVDDILIVAGAGFTELAAELCTERFGKVCAVTEGGNERQDSVYKGLLVASDKIQYDIANTLILVHDAARPFVTQEVINAVISSAEKTGAAVPAVPMKDTVRQAALCEGFSDMSELFEKGVSCDCTETLDRRLLCSVQTPQAFRADILLSAYKKAYMDGFLGTDDASIVERMGIKVTVVKGDYANHKITTKEDMRAEMKIGTGYDVHRLVEGRKLFLCSVEVPHSKGLLGHSDADVALHALMDALLGAAGLGDIGRHFPDSDDKYKGISSVKLLEEVCVMLRSEGFGIGNVDVTIMAQRPKIARYIPEMRKTVAEVLGIAESGVNIKGTTTEGLGFVGREEGIAAEAVCILYRN